MPKRQQLDVEQAAGFFDKPSKGKDRITAKGVGLRTSEWNRLQEIADELGVTRHELAVFIMRDWVRRYEAGERPKTQTKKTLVMPD